MNVVQAKESDAPRWDEFLNSQKAGSFLQSWSWGDFHRELGVLQGRFLVVDGEDIVACFLVTRRMLPLGLAWLYVPGGPVIEAGKERVLELITAELLRLGKETKALFVRCDTQTEDQTFSERLIGAAWKKADHEVQPQDTLVLHLEMSEEELLAGMHQKTRYNIRLGQKHGVKVRFSSDVKDVDVFWRLAHEVSRRGMFAYHPLSYYRSLLEVLGHAGKVEIAIAEYEGKPLAAHLMMYSGQTATYLHGASSREMKSVMAPYYLYWQTILRAKAKGMKCYDFYGVAPQGAGKEHPWFGVTRMKSGFGGRSIHYIGAYDLLIRSSMTKFMTMARRARSRLRR